MTLNPDRSRGFTLGELMTTLAVAAVSLSLAVPGYQTVTRNNRRATAVNQLVSTLHVARSEAVTRNQQVTICPSAGGEACEAGVEWHEGWIFFTDPDQDRQVGADETVLGLATGLNQLTVESDEFAGFIVYRPNGRVMVDAPDQNTGQFTLCDDRGASSGTVTHARVVIISASGQPSLSEHQADGSDPVCPDAA